MFDDVELGHCTYKKVCLPIRRQAAYTWTETPEGGRLQKQDRNLAENPSSWPHTSAWSNLTSQSQGRAKGEGASSGEFPVDVDGRSFTSDHAEPLEDKRRSACLD